MTLAKCPICAKEMTLWERYPNRVCEICQNRTSDAYGRRLQFSMDDLSGRFRAFYRDNGAEYHHQICYVDGRKCFAGEHRLGGVIIQVVEK